MGLVLNESNLSDKRSFKRAKLSGPVRFEFKDPECFGGCLSCDISEGGIRVRFNEFVPLGTNLSMGVQLDSGRVVECIGKVVWVSQIPFGDQYEIGLEFENIDSISESRSRIHHFIGEK